MKAFMGFSVSLCCVIGGAVASWEWLGVAGPASLAALIIGLAGLAAANGRREPGGS